MPSLDTSTGVSINYVDHGGDGETVLLVHGITEVSATWDPVVALLKSSNRVITMDLRGHGDSGTADAYGFDVMALDTNELVDHLGLSNFHLVGHSLGGIVVSAAGANGAAKTIVNVDQPLALAGFKEMLGGVEDQLKNPDAFPLVMAALFESMMGEKIDSAEAERIASVRRGTQEVVLGVWDMIFNKSVEEIGAVVDSAFAPYQEIKTPYLSLFGIDQGPDYAAWLAERIPSAEVELWADNGHYVHLVDPARFVARLHEFWAAN